MRIYHTQKNERNSEESLRIVENEKVRKESRSISREFFNSLRMNLYVQSICPSISRNASNANYANYLISLVQ